MWQNNKNWRVHMIQGGLFMLFNSQLQVKKSLFTGSTNTGASHLLYSHQQIPATCVLPQPRVLGTVTFVLC